MRFTYWSNKSSELFIYRDTINVIATFFSPDCIEKFCKLFNLRFKYMYMYIIIYIHVCMQGRVRLVIHNY